MEIRRKTKMDYKNIAKKLGIKVKGKRDFCKKISNYLNLPYIEHNFNIVLHLAIQEINLKQISQED